MNIELNMMRNICCKFNPYRVDTKPQYATVGFTYGYYCSILTDCL